MTASPDGHLAGMGHPPAGKPATASLGTGCDWGWGGSGSWWSIEGRRPGMGLATENPYVSACDSISSSLDGLEITICYWHGRWGAKSRWLRCSCGCDGRQFTRKPQTEQPRVSTTTTTTTTATIIRHFTSSSQLEADKAYELHMRTKSQSKRGNEVAWARRFMTVHRPSRAELTTTSTILRYILESLTCLTRYPIVRHVSLFGPWGNPCPLVLGMAPSALPESPVNLGCETVRQAKDSATGLF